jgi:hypothetical protein
MSSKVSFTACAYLIVDYGNAPAKQNQPTQLKNIDDERAE